MPTLSAVLRWFSIVLGTTLLLVAIGAPRAGGNRELHDAAISTTAPVIRLAADGTTVAAVVGDPRSECGVQTLIWDIRRKTPVVMPGKVDSAEAARSCPPSATNDEHALAVGGGMVGVIRFSVDHYEKSTLSITRIPTSGRWSDITAASDYEYGSGEGDYLSIFGDGSILAFSRWTGCYLYDPSDTCPGVSTDGNWWLSNGRLTALLPPGSRKAWKTIGRGQSFVGVAALDRGRFLVLPPKGQLAIIDANTGVAAALPIPTSSVRQADLDGPNLLILRTTAPGNAVLDIRAASTGALRKSWPLSSAAIKGSSIHLEDANAGIAAYRIGTTIHLLRITDGKSHTIPVPTDQGPVHARLENPGLIYSFSLPGRPLRGRIEFVPQAQLLAQLR